MLVPMTEGRAGWRHQGVCRLEFLLDTALRLHDGMMLDTVLRLSDGMMLDTVLTLHGGEE